MMEDLIKAFTKYAAPDTDAQRKQYQRMLDLTRSPPTLAPGFMVNNRIIGNYS